MWETYLAALAQAEEEWWDGDRPCEITAVAAATGIGPQELWDEVEGKRGWESHDQGYQGVVWMTAWGMKGYPDWQDVTPAPRTATEAVDDQWRRTNGDQQVGGA